MANLFSNMLNSGMDYFARTVARYINDQLGTRYSILQNYYTGDHRPQLRRKEGQPDDNIIQNFTGLAVDRSVSRLFRGGVDFALPEGAKKQQEYINRVWDLNKKEILMYQLGLHGAVSGTAYIEIVPDQINDPITGRMDYYPRLVPLYPPMMRVITSPHDVNEVIEYRIEYTIIQEGKETAWRKVVRRATPDEGIENSAGELSNDYWLVTLEVKEGSAQWRLIESIVWAYDFPPVLHWKNLPSLNSVYGDSDIDDAVNIQDKSNFVVSNNAKIVKFHASPKTVYIGVKASEIQRVDSSPDSGIAIPVPGAEAFNLEMQSDLESSRALSLDLRQSIFDVAREVDISSMSDRLGALTNFGLRVLYTDAMDKNDTKRQLYGDAFKEINRRLLILAGYVAEASDPGEVQWGEALAINVAEEMQTDKLALDMGIVDKQTVYERYQSRYGVDWEDMQKRLEAEDEKKRAEQERTFGSQSGGVGQAGGGEGGEPRPDNGQGAEGRQLPVAE